MSLQILRLPKVQAQTGFSRSGLYKAIAEGSFPSQISLGPRSVGCVETEINAVISARVAGRSLEEIKALVESLRTKRGEAAQV